MEIQSIADELRKVGGETMETRVIAAACIFGRAMMMEKLGKSDSAVELYAQADAAFRDAFNKENSHPFVHDMMLQVRKWSLNRLTLTAQQRGDLALEKEAWRQTKETIAELTALAEFEPLRLERWKMLAWVYSGNNGQARKFEGDEAWLAFAEECLKAADRASSPRFDRATVRRVRAYARVDVCKALAVVRPEGWAERVPKLIREAEEIVFTGRADDPIHTLRDMLMWRGLEHLRDVVAELGAKPGQRDAMIAQTSAALAYARRLIEKYPAVPKMRSDAAKRMAEIATILRDKGCAEAEEIEQACALWKTELEEKFPDDEEVVKSRANTAHERGFTLLNELRAAPKEEKGARFSALEKHCREAIAYAMQHEAHVKPHDFGRWMGGYFAALGSAQIEMGKFAEAEVSLKEAAARRTAAPESAPNHGEANGRRWDAADSRLRQAVTVFRQGRVDEARKVGAQAIEVFQSQAQASSDFRKYGRLMGGLREYAELYSGDELKADRLAIYGRCVKSAREAMRLLAANAGGNENDRYGISSDIGYSFLECGRRSRNAGDAAAAEAHLRDGVAFIAGVIAKCPPARFTGLAMLFANLRYDLGISLADAKRPDEVRNEIEAIQSLLAQYEQNPGANQTGTGRMRGWIEDLRKRLPSQ